MIEAIDAVRSRLEGIWSASPLQLSANGCNELYCEVPPERLSEFCAALAQHFQARLMSVVGLEEAEGFRVVYLFSLPGHDLFVGASARIDRQDPTYPSVTPVIRAAHWYERELHDLLGLTPAGHPHLDPLVLHPDWPKGIHPLRKEVDLTRAIPRVKRSDQKGLSRQEGVFELPFGPVRAGVVESAHFRFLTIGEEILRLEMQLFYKFRGIERLFEQTPIHLAPLVAERVSGISSFAHSLAFSQAIERAAGIEVPRRAHLLRTLYAELERIYNHLGNLAHLCEATSLRVGQAQFSILQEELKRLNAHLTGHRFLRGVNTIGGLRRDLHPEKARLALHAIDRLGRQFVSLVDLLMDTKSHIDRLATTGLLSQKVAVEYGAMGPVARASGLKMDLRKDHPYAAYSELDFQIPVYAYGDALARMRVRIDETLESIQMIRQILDRFTPGPVLAEVGSIPPGRQAIGYAESPRGAIVDFVVTGEDHTLYRCKIRSPSFCNWYLFQTTVENTMMMDWPINERSFELTHAGCDL